MAVIYKNFKSRILNSGPVFLLYYLSISEIDTQFSNLYEILSFNLQLIIIYYWMLRDEDIIGTGHIFFAGIINDVVTGLPLGISSILYLVGAFIALYIKNLTVNISLFTDWFTFLIAIFFSNLSFYILMTNFSDFKITYTDLFYNSFFTFLFYPIFWTIFKFYKQLMILKQHD